MSSEKTFQIFTDKLNALNRKNLFLILSSSLFKFFSIVLIIYFIFLVLEANLFFASNIKLFIEILILLSIGVTFYFSFHGFIKYVLIKRQSSNLKSIAREIGNKYPKIKDRLLNAFEIYSQKEHLNKLYSSSLIENVVERDVRPYMDYDFNVVLDKRNLKKESIRLAITFLCVAVISFPFFGDLVNAHDRLINFSKDNNLKIPVLNIYPENITVIYGDSLKIQVYSDELADLENLTLLLKKDTQFNYEPESFDNSNVYNLKNIKEPYSYFVRAEKRITRFRKQVIRSENFRINVINRPMVKLLRADIKFPAYTGIEQTFLEENIGDIYAIKGSQVNLKFESNKNIEAAYIDFEEGAEQQFNVYGKKGSASFRVKSNNKYKIILQDTLGILNLNPIEYRITATYDENPFVEITRPGMDVDLSDDLLLPLSIKIGDDFGITRLELFYTKIYEEENKKAEIPPKSDFEKITIGLDDFSGIIREIFYNWNMTDLGLLPSNKVFYFAKVYDNDRISGFKNTETKIFSARVPSMYELFEEVRNEQNENIVDLESVLEEGKKLKETLEKLQLELKKSSELDWEKKKALNEAAEKRKKLMEKVDNIEENLQKVADKLEKNRLTAIETLQKYAELQKILQEIKSPELKKALDKLRESLEKFDDKKLKSETNKMVMDNEEFLKKIERTLSILKHIMREQQLDELVKKAEELANRQNNILENLEKKDTDLNQTANMQENIGKDIEKFEKSFKDIYRDLMSEPLVPQNIMDKVDRDLKEAKLGELSSEARKNMQAGNISNAAKSGKDIKNKLNSIKNDLQEAKNRMVNNFKQKVLNELRKNSFDLLSLSSKQEGLKNETAGTEANSPKIGKIADDLLDAMSGLNRVANNLMNLSNETFFVTPEMGEAISEAFMGMRSGLRMLEERNPNGSAKQQESALAGLNKAVLEIANSMNNLKKSGSGGGLEEYMKHLQEMAKKQEAINKATIQLPGGEQLGQQQIEQARRLSRDQEALRKTLEQLQRELGNRQTLGDLNKIAEDMREVTRELDKARIDSRTLKKQERILSRLLDAQRSMHRSDYSRKRLSERPEEYRAINPGILPEDMGEKDIFLRTKLREALSEKYSNDYKELIKRYFEKIKEVKLKEEIK